MSDRQILTVAQMQAAEQALIDAGTDVHALMRIAGSGAADWVWRMAAGRSVTVLCGPGNNGGDGYVISQRLAERGLAVRVVAPIEPKTEAAKRARTEFGGEVWSSGNGTSGEVLVDCLFGSGLTRPLSAELELMLRDLAQRHPFHIAVDCPSGVESDSGKLLNEGLPLYDLTLALGAWKYAHWRMPSRAKMGQLRLVPIGVQSVGGAALAAVRPRLSAPAADSHKYRRGLLAIIGGEMAGAAMLSAQSAMRAGAGYVKLFSEHSHPHAPAGLVVDDAALDDALADERIDALLVGPGLGRSDQSRERLAAALETDCAKVLDADALHLLDSDALEGCDANRILVTPHEGELVQLCRAFGAIGDDKLGRAQSLANLTGLTILAKGSDTILCPPSEPPTFFSAAPSWLSVAGTGDVLAGIAASRMANGSDPAQAAEEAAWIHGEAARLCGPAFTADDLAAQVSNALAKFL